MVIVKKQGKVRRLKKCEIINEKEIQSFLQNNVEKIFGFKLIKSEFIIKNFRFDSLTYDEDANSY